MTPWTFWLDNCLSQNWQIIVKHPRFISISSLSNKRVTPSEWKRCHGDVNTARFEIFDLGAAWATSPTPLSDSPFRFLSWLKTSVAATTRISWAGKTKKKFFLHFFNFSLSLLITFAHQVISAVHENNEKCLRRSKRKRKQKQFADNYAKSERASISTKESQWTLMEIVLRFFLFVFD